MMRFDTVLFLLATGVAFVVSGCSLVVDFDRSLLVDAGVDAAPDASVDAGGEEPADAN
ncbi:MAG: hypothetical protein JRG67_03570 [Deltaproteobacteria bacterium]|nr:hypothetical protein [Deltaproteobacteria bacterium]MBW1873904.1 hypothetical protein [Deltaproteobacteria bacterium]MBW2210114.1 hypothetical protein [Deltaproteobacteria bacterium]MBW2214432.1 hypothetical protein [Deltaproteobacteria bacterium]MBW2549210.1 hypothetical protein [Deltaproteobacteria bacterium]